MPSPVTAHLPKPKSWDEFEDIVADVIRRLWNDPYATRNGRSGQSQHGVDIYGKPQHLGSTAYGGVQCKRIEEPLTFDGVKALVKDAKEFKPALKEFVIVSSSTQNHPPLSSSKPPTP